MKAHVDKDTCIGCGLCPSICEAVFVLEDDGNAMESAPGIKIPPPAQEDAEASCPVNAIVVE